VTDCGAENFKQIIAIRPCSLNLTSNWALCAHRRGIIAKHPLTEANGWSRLFANDKRNLALLADALKVPQQVNSPNSPRPDATLTDR